MTKFVPLLLTVLTSTNVRAGVCSDLLLRYPQDLTQITSKFESWVSFVEDIERIDFDAEVPKLSLTHYIDRGSPILNAAIFEVPETFVVEPMLIEGWKNLGFLKSGKFQLPEASEVIQRFNEQGPMRAWLSSSGKADDAPDYGQMLAQNKVPIVDIHDILFHLPLLSVARAREYLQFFGFELSQTKVSISNSSLNTIFEQGTKAKNGTFTAQLLLIRTGVENWDFSSDTLAEFLADAEPFLENLGSNLQSSPNDSYYRAKSVMTDSDAMWFAGLVKSHLRLLDFLYVSEENFFAITDAKRRERIRDELELNLVRLETFKERLGSEYPAAFIEKLKAY